MDLKGVHFDGKGFLSTIITKTQSQLTTDANATVDWSNPNHHCISSSKSVVKTKNQTFSALLACRV